MTDSPTGYPEVSEIKPKLKGSHLPKWVIEFLRLRRVATAIPTPQGGNWTKEDDGRYSRPIYIAYPNGVYYELDKLVDGKWISRDEMHFIPETAYSSAQKKAYFDDVPYRVREVVWRG